MKIAERRFSGAQPLRPVVGKEYALAFEWTDAALTIAKQQHKNKHREDSMKRFTEQGWNIMITDTHLLGREKIIRMGTFLSEELSQNQIMIQTRL